MKRILFLILLMFSMSAFAQFDKYFASKTLRMDYYHSGNHDTSSFSFDELIVEPFWGGSEVNLIDTFEYGNYYIRLYDLKSDSLIYSRGFSSIFGEWQTTDESKEINRAMSESVVMPFPKNDVRIELYERNWDGLFEKKFEYTFKKDNYFTNHESRKKFPNFSFHKSGDPSQKVDVVIIPEGYSADEMGKFVEDCQKFTNDMFAYQPYSENKDKFNIWCVLAPSQESGVDIPAEGIWKNTIMNFGYYTFDSERYLMTFDNKSVRDIAANAPYDQIYILVNSDKYGGGAIYNFYNVSVNSNSKSAAILIHEFGHGFAGLADEYFDSSTSYNDFYNLEVEPWEPNITTLVNFDKKWKHLLKKHTPIPTADPLKKKNMNKLGAYEGGGYVAKGVYRPRFDCMMKTFDGDTFCPACVEAIQKMIEFYSQ
ncbi:MAG: peptidase M64 [Chlorobi bacterium]|nr:peptidase M64 [Chlorobiota bacterium]